MNTFKSLTSTVPSLETPLISKSINKRPETSPNKKRSPDLSMRAKQLK